MPTTTRVLLTDYIRRKLGEPILKVELDNSQIDDCIEDALIYYREWSHMGVYDSVYALSAVAKQKTYVLPPEIQEVKEVVTASFSRVLTTNIIDPYLDIFGPKNQGFSLVEIGSEYLSDVQRMFGTKYQFSTHKQGTGEVVLELMPAPARDQYLGLKVTKYVPEDELLNTRWVRQYALALSMKLLGEIRSKYAQLAGPNGPQLNGSELISDANQMIQELENEIQTKHYRPIGIFQG